jgi:CSLREA domain-containing protein
LFSRILSKEVAMTRSTHFLPLIIALAGLAVVVAVLGLSPASPAQAVSISVTTTDDENNSDGDCSLREAIGAANNDVAFDACAAGSGADVITIPAGTYNLTMGELQFADDVTLNGAGAASTIIDGGDNGRIFAIFNVGITNAITGLTVQNGTAGSGGGITNNATLTIDDVVVQDNFADGDGGGIFNSSNGTLNATNCTVSGNEAAVDGGGIENQGPDTLNLTNCTVSGNVAGDNGGGVSNTFDATGTINQSTISGNKSFSDGGGVSIDQCCGVEPFVIMNSAITGNNSGDDGGGVEIQGGAATLTNVTFSGNAASVESTGGGMIVDGGTTATLTNVTITNNTASPAGGGGLAVGGEATLLNTIVAGNPDGDDCALFEGTVISSGHNLSSDDTCDFTGTGDLINTDAVLQALALNAPGSTQTHALTATSPAVDAGDGAGCPATDQRGVTRPQDGNLDGTAICDIGAYELQVAVATATPTSTPTLAPAALPPTGGESGSGGGVAWLGLLAAAALALTGGALAFSRARRQTA